MSSTDEPSVQTEHKDEPSLQSDVETSDDGKPRQWLYDRSNGKSKDGETRPPCPLCWAPPCVKIAPDCFEQNCCCENLGKVGCVDGDETGQSKRTKIMAVGLASNILGLIFSIVACFGISTNFGMLETVPYTRITATSNAPLFDNITMSIGLVATAVRNPPNRTEETLVVPAQQYCEVAGLRFRAIIQYEDCQRCAEVSAGLVFTVIMSCVTYIPSIGTNVLRMYPHYDVNCQKVFGVLSTTFSLIMSGITWNGYITDCLQAFTVGPVAFNRLGNQVEVGSPNAVINIFLNPHRGVGLIMIATATCLKFVDIIAHLLLPTPAITRSRRLQMEYEKRR